MHQHRRAWLAGYLRRLVRKAALALAADIEPKRFFEQLDFLGVMAIDVIKQRSKMIGKFLESRFIPFIETIELGHELANSGAEPRMVRREALDAILKIRLHVKHFTHVAAFFLDAHQAFEMPLKRLGGELDAGQFSRHAYDRRLPVERHAEGLLDVFQDLMLHPGDGKRCVFM